MTRTYHVPFEWIALMPGEDPHDPDSWTLKTEWYTVRVTDKAEERDAWKRAEAIRRAARKFEAANGFAAGQGARHVRKDKIEEVTR